MMKLNIKFQTIYVTQTKWIVFLGKVLSHFNVFLHYFSLSFQYTKYVCFSHEEL